MKNQANQPYENKLIHEKSPYLLQHAHNPVDWYPWGEEAFEKAKREDKPVLVSIGYSTCHWCHVMERESFEDEETAKLLNDRFVAIKVDREERPDIDSIYMKVCQGLTGQGGWPLNVFLTSDQKPFYAGTYFPKESRYNIPGFKDAIIQLYQQYKENPDRITGIGDKITASLQERMNAEGGELTEEPLHNAFEQMQNSFDTIFGGFGQSPKFPSPHMLMYLLRYYRQYDNDLALTMVTRTLDAMAKGGIYDHVGYGFARYAVDQEWLVPHFEKMLYDNAMLALTYTEAYQVTGEEHYKKVACDVLEYVTRDMTSEQGGFYSAEDADSEGEEGKFYVWTESEVHDILGDKLGSLYCKAYDITSKGNFEGKNIPNLIQTDLSKVAKSFSMTEKDVNKQLEEARKKLYEVREKRIHPYKDDKILTSWNMLMIAAFAKAGRVFAEHTYTQTAEESFRFIEENLVIDGRLMARYRDGEVKFKAYHDDYAYGLWALNELYEATFKSEYLLKAKKLSDEMHDLFWDDSAGGFYLYGHDADELIARPKDVHDGALPSGNSVAVLQLLRLSKLTGEAKYDVWANKMFTAFSGDVSSYSSGHAYFLMSKLYTLSSPKEVVIVGDNGDTSKEKIEEFLQQNFFPELTVISTADPTLLKEAASFAAEFEKTDTTTIYVCENFSCSLPETNVEKVIKELDN
ncbi:thioredoxin domain-containing protein [Anaerobacillus sp. 1_MG-2023]|uniref:thioredoxin domain-containing protein n=1 Tax=Anaerobacillus sp. 1_MG-2023 TaxID=3062655 RepID=UPI0026E2AD28|nr:thioredoxin domain-containing protein [Anaerobacillus sp. 1_MG-2023]MDO6656936.1 thioredoxin domain-containing protein [Anaerobacillus sp. 1_MG-2023]